MKIGLLIVAAVAGFVLARPGWADDAATARAEFEPRELFRGIVREDDLALLMDHLRQALAAAAEGRDPPATDALDARAAELARALKLRGWVTLKGLLDALEAETRRSRPEPGPRLLPPAPLAIPARQEI